MAIGPHLSHLDSLIRHGRHLREALEGDPSGESAIAATRVWQQECAALIHQLSGGTKAHWLARAYSEAFLIRSSPDHLIEEAPAAEIVTRVVGVLEQATLALSMMPTMNDGAGVSAPPASRPHRFDFVHNRDLRPILEQAYADSRHAL